MAPASMPWTAVQGPCQRFARNYATRNLAPPHTPILGSAFHLGGCVAAGGSARRRELPAHRWHARGQGFKSPQLHQAQRIFHFRPEHYLPEICQKTRSVVVRTLAVLSGFGGLEGLLSEQ